LSASTNKKVIVQRFDREAVSGFVNPASYLRSDGVELLSTGGVLTLLPYADVKAVLFVRDFRSQARDSDQKVFHSRPRQEGLWVRMEYRDGETMEGLMANSLLELDPRGFTVIPPNPSSNSQKIFVPRLALRSFHILAVIGSPLRERKKKPVPAPETQLEMFE
jgi:hypothetical protein